MGQKTHPIGFRLGVVKTWNSCWFEDRHYTEWLHEDLEIRSFLKRELRSASVADITIERAANKLKVNLFSARPGIIIGKRGAGIERLKRVTQRMTKSEVFLNVQEVRKAEINAQLVAENICQQLERRIAFRRALKRSLQTAMKYGAKGIRVMASGRLTGSEMSRREKYHAGRVPLHTLRANIDYGFAEARKNSGRIGVKVWIFNGEVYGPRAAQTSSPRFPKVKAK